jgi:hypothetical protein
VASGVWMLWKSGEDIWKIGGEWNSRFGQAELEGLARLRGAST